MESTPQQSVDIEFQDRLNTFGSGPIQILNFSQKKKLISEIASS